MNSAPESLSRAAVVRVVGRSIAARQPLSVVRFGEGEGRLLVLDPADPVSVRTAQKKLQKQSGQDLPPTELVRIQERLLYALDESDIAGVHGSTSFSDEHRDWVARIEGLVASRWAAGSFKGYTCHSLVSNSIRDALPELLSDEEMCSVISCRDLSGYLSWCGIEDVVQYQIPSQFIMRGVDGEYEARLHGLPMWPDFREGLRDSLTVRRPGEVFLVGAGVFGKDLCVDIARAGGIALDLGSCLDGLVGKVTRGKGRPAPHVAPPPG